VSARPAVAVWSPLPPSPSGIADYVAEQLPALARHADVRAVSSEPHASAERTVVDELDVYHVGNSPAHAWVYRAALRRPGVVVLHDWSLHQLVLCETVERGDVSTYLREMRRAHGETGSFVGRQVARALGGSILPALYPVNERLLEGALGIVTLSESTAERVAQRLPGRPLLHLRHHLALPLDPLPSRAEARRALGLGDGPILTAPGLATATKGLQAAVQVAARLRARHAGLRLVVAGGVEPGLPLGEWARSAGLGDGLVVTGRLDLADFVRHLCAADVVLALRFPSYGEMSGALVRALGVGRPALVTAGTPAAAEFPEGVVAVVDPGPAERYELEAIVGHLLAHPHRAEAMGGEAAAYVRAHHDLERTTAALAAFLADMAAQAPRARRALLAERAADAGRLGFFLDEVRPGARELGLSAGGLGIEALLRELAGEAP
jgi:glycosyltransferase involved in cell wall biosynthesis